jgi:hypothetical protein
MSDTSSRFALVALVGMVGFTLDRWFDGLLIRKDLLAPRGGSWWVWLALLLALFRTVLLILKDLVALLPSKKTDRGWVPGVSLDLWHALATFSLCM